MASLRQGTTRRLILKAIAVLAAIVVLAACEVERANLATVEPPTASVNVPSDYPAAEARLAAHHPNRVPGDFQTLWDDAMKREPLSGDGQFFYHVAATGDRAVAVLVPKVSMFPAAPVVMAQHRLAVEQAFSIDLSRVPLLSERQANTAFGQALAFDAFGQTYNVVKVRTQREPPENERESLTLLIWRGPVAATIPANRPETRPAKP